MAYPSPNKVFCRTLSTGVIRVVGKSGQYIPDTLFDIAERHNPKRAFLFVSKVLGRHIPVSPAVMRSVYRELAAQFPTTLDGPVLFIGMAETAVGLGAGVYDTLKDTVPHPVYLSSTRYHIDATLLCEFKEAHSHATDHLLYLPHDAHMRERVLNARTLVLIDDEATTGNTFINLLAALQQDARLSHLEQVITVTLTDWSDSALVARSPLPATSLSLITGSWSWEPFNDAPLPAMPKVAAIMHKKQPLCARQTWGRLGMTTTQDDLAPHVCAVKGEKLLVLGSNEFVWPPFLLAERLEREGADVKFSATTRSPVAQGHAIQSVISFSDNYGQGIPNFLYNVAHQTFDRIILCIETPRESVDPRLIAALKKITPCVDIQVYE